MQRPFGNFFICSRHRGDNVPCVAHPFQGDDGLVFNVSSIVRRADIEIIPREDGHYARNRSRFICVDTTNARMRKRAAKDLDMGHTRQSDIARIQRAARYLLRSVNTRNALSDRWRHNQIPFDFVSFAARWIDSIII